MKIITIILFLNFNAYSQDTLQGWISNIDSSKFSIYYSKQEIPCEFYSIIKIRNLNDIASGKDVFQIGCVGTKNSKTRKLNWLAKDSYNHWILSVSYGGRFYGTVYYYINKTSKKLTINDLSFFGSQDVDELTLQKTIINIKSKKYNDIGKTNIIELK